MASDFKGYIDDVKFNVRAGVIMKYKDTVLVEISRAGENSVIPGGRVKINEYSRDALKREIKEEMNIDLKDNQLSFKAMIENLFNSEGIDYHELFFVYEYRLNDDDYEMFKNVGNNKDNVKTWFEFVPATEEELTKVDLLPEELFDYIIE